MEALQSGAWWWFAAAVIGAQRANKPLELGLEDGVVGLITAEVSGQAAADLVSLAVVPSENITVD